jgi:AMMECR1 domain-containing protein
MICRIAMKSRIMTATFSNSLAMRSNSRFSFFSFCLFASLLNSFAFYFVSSCAAANVASSVGEPSATVRIAPGAQYEWRDPDSSAKKSGKVLSEKQSAASADLSSTNAKIVSLTAVANFTLRRFFKLEANDGGLEDYASKVKCDAAFRKPAGVFVTISKNGKTRACWGTVYAQQADIVRETVFSTLGALSKEYRFRPIRKSELPDLKIQVSIIRDITAINGFASVNPLKDGIMVRSGGRSGVILPGEATDAYYEFVLARLKAGIKPGEPCQIYKLRTDIYD